MMKTWAARGGGGDHSVAVRRATFLFTYLAYCAVYLERKPVSVVKPILSSELGLSTAALAGIDTAWLFCYALGQLSLGTLRTFLSQNVLVSAGFLGSGVATALCGVCSSAGSLTAAWGANGFFQSSINPLLVLFVADMYPASGRAMAVGLWQTSQQIGGVAANFFAASTLQRSGWRAIFFQAGGIAAALAAPLFFVLAAPKTSPERGAAAPLKRTKGGQQPAGPLVGVNSVCVAYFLVKMTRYCLMFWLPFFLVKAAGVDASSAAKLATLLDVGGAAGSVCVGFVASKVCGGAMLAACVPFTLATAALLVVHAHVYERGVYWNAACMLGVGFCVAAPDGILGGAIARNLCEYNGVQDAAARAPAISGLINGCGSVGAILQGFGAAALVAALGWKGLFYSLAAATALSTIALGPALDLERRHFANIAKTVDYSP